MKKILGLAVLLLLSGCSAARPAPSWLTAGSNQLEVYQKVFLSGRDRLADLHFQSALAEVKKSGDLELLARVYLIRMALQTAVLADREQEEYLKIDALSPNPENRSFFALLSGVATQVDADLLPPRYRAFAKTLKMKASAADQLREVEKMVEPLSRLVATGILVRMGWNNETLLEGAVDNASAQGWKKALVVYLTRLKSSYESNDEGAKARAVEQRLNLIRD